MRSFIEEALYGPAGYFRRAPLIIDARQPLASHSAAALTDAVGKLYRGAAQSAEFATASSMWPVHYAHAVSAWCRARHVSTVVEVGGGSGALAAALLASRPDLTFYHAVEISAELAETQRSAVQRVGQAARHAVHNASFFDWSGPPTVRGKVGLLAFEVFDNLACDKLVVSPSGAAKQAFVELRADGSRVEVYRDVADAAVLRCLELWLAAHPPPPNRPHGFVLWLPTRAYEFVEHTKRLFGADVELLVADFDALPSTNAVGVNAPVIQRNSIGAAGATDTIQTFDNLLRAPVGAVDIMFETSFPFLARCLARDVTIEKHAAFLRQFAPDMPKAMREFYPNMSVLRT